MTRQEMFDKAYLGLASQGFRKSIDGLGCAYRGQGGLKCAVGWLIPDERYQRELEECPCDAPEIMLAVGMVESDVLLVADLQAAHDDGDPPFKGTPEAMKSRLADVAKQYGLTIPQVPV